MSRLSKQFVWLCKTCAHGTPGELGTHLETGPQKLHNVAVVAGAQNKDLPPEGFRVAQLVVARDLVREDLHSHHLHAIAVGLVHLLAETMMLSSAAANCSYPYTL